MKRIFFVCIFALVFTTGVFGGKGKMNCDTIPCKLELCVYTDNKNYKNLFMEKVKVASEIMCTFRDVQITKITHIQNKNNLPYSDVVIYDQTYQDIKFPFKEEENNINNYGYYIGVDAQNITDINIANKILQFLGKSTIPLERKCLNGYIYGSSCQTNSDCGNYYTCNPFYPTNDLYLKSRNTCHRSNIIYEIQFPSNPGVHIIFDRTIYSKNFDLVKNTIDHVNSYFKEYQINVKSRDFFPYNIEPRCGYVSKNYSHYESYCGNYQYSNYVVNLEFKYSNSYTYCDHGPYGHKNDYKSICRIHDVYDDTINTICWNNGCESFWQKRYSGQNVRSCYYVCENNILLKNITLNNIEYYYPTNFDHDKNIEPFFKNYYLNNVNEFDHLVYITSGKFDMSESEFKAFSNDIYNNFRKIDIFAFNNGKTNSQLNEMVERSHGNMYTMDYTKNSGTIMNIKIQKNILKLIADIQAKKVISDIVNEAWFDTNYYKNINAAQVNIIGNHFNSEVIDNRGINYAPQIKSITVNGQKSMIFTINNPQQGLWRMKINPTTYYESITLADDIYYTGNLKKINTQLEFIPSQKINVNLTGHLYNDYTGTFLRIIDIPKNSKGIFVYDVNSENFGRKLEIIDNLYVSNPLVYINPNNYCNDAGGCDAVPITDNYNILYNNIHFIDN
jgi:hypothetical protein